MQKRLLFLLFSIINATSLLASEDGRNLFKEALIGGGVGGIEAAASMPLVTIKNCMQTKKPIVWSPRFLLQGLSINFVCMIPATAMQVSLNAGLKSLLPGESFAENLESAALAGTTSAVLVTPIEFLIVQKQMLKLPFGEVLHLIRRKSGPLAFYRGLLPTMAREGIFAPAYLVLFPWVSEQLKDLSHDHLESESMRNFLEAEFLYVSPQKATTAFIVGPIVAAMSHPFDTAKTWLQEDLDADARKIAKKARTLGMKSLMDGYTARSFLVASAILVMGAAHEGLTEALQ